MLAGEASAFLEEGNPEMLEGFPEEVAGIPASSTAISFQTQQGSHTLPEISVLMRDQVLLLNSVCGLRTMHSAGPSHAGV